MKRGISMLAIAAACASITAGLWAADGVWAGLPGGDGPIVDAPRVDDRVHDEPPLVQIALLLDTSNSMDGLIDQARTQLWSVVNEVNRAKRKGRAPRLQVALYEYGNNAIPESTGYVRQVLPFTENLDLVSEKLFCLTTNGGSEHCGQVIQAATLGLSWCAKPTTYRSIFIAGNEPFTQGPVDFRLVCPAAHDRGIVINTLHCGDSQAGLTTQWAAGAQLGGGKWLNIDHNRVVIDIAAPQDEKINTLSAKLNETYIPYGHEGAQGAQRQLQQDGLAMENASRGSAVQRAGAKASSNYTNAGWDLVDAVKEDREKLAEVPASALPETMRQMSADERQQYVQEMARKRQELQGQIQTLMAEREAYVAREREKRADAQDAQTLDTALITTVREQLRTQEWEVAE